MHAIICEDPSHRHNIGTIIEGKNEIAMLKRQGAALLPFDPELPSLAHMGYVQNFHGTGRLFENNTGTRGCPSMINVTPECRFIYWAARVKPRNPDDAWSLKLRLVHGSVGRQGIGRGMNHITHVESAPELDKSGSAIVYGVSGLNSPSDGLLFTDLYAVATNTLVIWSAMTQHRESYQWSSAG